jgi:DNA helicase-2/ATP-dependent DNA helicase PcrA
MAEVNGVKGVGFSGNASVVDGVIHLQKEITPVDLAHLIAKYTGELKLPTNEQSAVIGSKHFGAAVINAGAGSGKTETMAQRVLWLVANGVVRPNEILGLTFTRKAAGELSTRIRERLSQLRKDEKIAKDVLTGEVPDIAVDVSTYHAYAGRALSEYGIRLGVDADVEPIGEAAEWQLTYELVSHVVQTEYPLQKSPNTIVENVMSLSSQLAEHKRTTAEVRSIDEALLQKFLSIEGKQDNEEVRNVIVLLKERLSILEMVDKVNEYRKANGLLTFDDHMTYAADLSELIPDMATRESARYKVVILDEYQDTSQSQVRFLKNLFGNKGHSVTAVGDPYQSIYGWRGAAAQTIENFGKNFAASEKCEDFELFISWRNDKKILDFANEVIKRVQLEAGVAQPKDRLLLNDYAGPGNLVAGRFLTEDDEAQAIADYFEPLWNDEKRMATPLRKRSKFAVLVRTKSQISRIEKALIDAGIPTEVIGLGGLIHTPEVADIIALLRVLTFPDHGSALSHLIAGPRLALGAKDLMELGRFARKLTEDSQESRNKRLEELLETEGDQSLEAEDFAVGSIIEALDVIDKVEGVYFSPTGLKRLKEFSNELSVLRRAMRGSITDCIIEAERFLRLDTEVLVRDGWVTGRRHLDAFLDEASNFQRSGGTLSTFLRWLEIADKEEGGLKPATVSASAEAVQILTIHTSKGSEWNVVAIPGLNKGNFPSSGKASDSWLKSSGSIPLQLRGDHLHFNDFEFPTEKVSFSEAKKALDRFDEGWKAKRREEELRLAYVAFTRAKNHLICTSTVYGEGKKPREESELYTWLADWLEQNDPTSVISTAEKLDEGNPNLMRDRSEIWPRAGKRQVEIQRSAKYLTSFESKAKLDSLDPSTDDEKSLLRDTQALITEIAQSSATSLVYLPSRLSVSTLIRLAQDSDELALNIRRPMPHHTDTFARRGTDFHEWIERKFASERLYDDDDMAMTLDFEEDLRTDEEDFEKKKSTPLKELQDQWMASEWGSRTPLSVEEGFETVIEGILLRGRIDAVYKISEDRYEVVDWKTGKVKSGEDLAFAAIQLAMYRLAYSKLHAIPLENISAAFHYIPSNMTVRPADIMNEEDIKKIIQKFELAV